MADVTVKFLGKEYTFPDELQEYVLYCDEFEEINDLLQKRLLKTMEIPSISDGEPSQAGEIETSLKDAMREEGREVITMLAENSIFDVTESDLMDNNEGFKYYDSVYRKMMQGLSKNLAEEIQNYIDRSDQAQSAAYSQVTGSGVGILSNSLWGIMTYTALESGVVKKQAEQAQGEYQAALQNIWEMGKSEREQKDAEVMLNTYPEIAKAFNMFVTNLLDMYLNRLQQAGVYDYDKTKAYNMTRSTELLKNTDLVSDKRPVLAAAFEICPFNPDIYSKALELDVYDADTIKTAEYFHQGYPFEQAAKEAIDKYTETKDLLNDECKLENWVKEYIAGSYSDVSILTKEKIRTKVDMYVGSLMKYPQFQALSKSGLLKPEDIRLESSTQTGFYSINNEIVDALTNKTNDYINQPETKDHFKQHDQQIAKEKADKKRQEEEVKRQEEYKARQKQVMEDNNIRVSILLCTVLAIFGVVLTVFSLLLFYGSSRIIFAFLGILTAVFCVFFDGLLIFEYRHNH